MPKKHIVTDEEIDDMVNEGYADPLEIEDEEAAHNVYGERIAFTQEQAGFEADVNEQFLSVPMSDEAIKIYKELEKQKCYTRYNPATGKEMTATVNSGADLINKLCQISSGTSMAIKRKSRQITPEKDA